MSARRRGCGELVCVGLTSVDVQQRVAAFPVDGTTARAKWQRVAAGGSAASAAITAAGLGSGVTLVTALGRHPLAQLLLRELSGFGVRVVDLTPAGFLPPSVRSVVVHERTGERRTVAGAETGLSKGEVPAELAALVLDADAVLVDGTHQAAALAASADTAAGRAPVIRHVETPQEANDRLLPRADILLCCAVDGRPADWSAEPVRRLRGAVQYGVLAPGRGPVRWWDDGQRSGEVPLPEVAVEDTSGVGDVFAGAFAHAVAATAWRDRPLPEYVEFAVDIAADRVQHLGSREWLNRLP